MMGKEVVAIGTGEYGLPPNFVYREWAFPALLNDADCREIIDISLISLRALGLGWGPTGIEFRWTKARSSRH